MKNTILTALFALLLLSCEAQKSITDQKPVDANKEVSNSAFFTSIKKAPEFSQLKITTKLQAKTGSFVPTIDGTIYIEEGSKVWMNYSALFLQVARGIATPEGVKGYEKWNKRYIDSSYEYLNNLLGVDFLNYQTLERLLVGKTFIPVDEKNYILTKNLSGYTLKSRSNQRFSTSSGTNTYGVTLDYSGNFDLNRVLLQQENSSNSLEVLYAGWEQVGETRLPKNVKIIINANKQSEILLENTKFDFIKSPTPYQVPSGYSKVVIK